jgi:hypothetical protein
VLLKRKLARVVVLYLAYSVRQLGPGVFDGGLGTELMLAAEETSMGVPSGADAAAVESARDSESGKRVLTIFGLPRRAAGMDMDMMGSPYEGRHARSEKCRWKMTVAG